MLHFSPFNFVHGFCVNGIPRLALTSQLFQLMFEIHVVKFMMVFVFFCYEMGESECGVDWGCLRAHQRLSFFILIETNMQYHVYIAFYWFSCCANGEKKRHSTTIILLIIFFFFLKTFFSRLPLSKHYITLFFPLFFCHQQEHIWLYETWFVWGPIVISLRYLISNWLEWLKSEKSLCCTNRIKRKQITR